MPANIQQWKLKAAKWEGEFMVGDVAKVVMKIISAWVGDCITDDKQIKSKDVS